MQGKIMIAVRLLYGLISSSAPLITLLAEVLHDMGYVSSKADPYVYLRPAIKSNRFKYHKYVLCYVDDVLYISDNNMTTMQC